MKNYFNIKLPFIRHTAAYLMANGITSIIAFALIPFITVKLTPAEYGIAGIYLAICAIVFGILEYSFLVRKAYIDEPQGTKVSQIITSCFVFYTLGCAICMLAIWVYKDAWLSIFSLDYKWALLACMNGFMLAALTLAFAIWQISYQVQKYCIYKYILVALNALFTLLGLYCFALGWQALAWASLLSAFIVLFVAIIRCKTDFLKWNLSTSSLKTCAKSIATLIPHKISLTLFAYIGPILVAYYADLKESGLYLFAFQIGSIVALFYESLLLAVIPHVIADTQSYKRRKFLIYYIAAIGLASLGMVCLTPILITMIFPSEYIGAISLVKWVILARFFHAVNRMVQEITFFRINNFHIISLASLLSAGLYVATTIIFLGSGSMGGVVGLAIGHGIWMVSMMLSSYATLKNNT